MDFELTDQLLDKIIVVHQALNLLTNTEDNHLIHLYFNAPISIPMNCSPIVRHYAYALGIPITEEGIVIVINGIASIDIFTQLLQNLQVAIAKHLDLTSNTKKMNKKVQNTAFLPIDSVLIKESELSDLSLTPEFIIRLKDFRKSVSFISETIKIYANAPISIPIKAFPDIRNFAKMIGIPTVSDNLVFMITSLDDCNVILAQIQQLNSYIVKYEELSPKVTPLPKKMENKFMSNNITSIPSHIAIQPIMPPQTPQPTQSSQPNHSQNRIKQPAKIINNQSEFYETNAISQPPKQPTLLSQMKLILSRLFGLSTIITICITLIFFIGQTIGFIPNYHLIINFPALTETQNAFATILLFEVTIFIVLFGLYCFHQKSRDWIASKTGLPVILNLNLPKIKHNS